MSGLFRRLRRDRHASPDSAAATASAAGASPHDPRPYTEGDAHEESTAVLQPAEATGEELDALVGSAPTTRRRGRLRRRLRHLRQVREVLMRDLGGFVFEVHRSGPGEADSVVEAKLRRLAAVDAELRELEAMLDDRRPLVLREAGIGGACPHCGELFASEARFCWACGTPVAAGAGHRPQLLPAYAAAIEPGTQPTSVLPETQHASDATTPAPGTAEVTPGGTGDAQPATEPVEPRSQEEPRT